jgi:hypothetical protein
VIVMPPLNRDSPQWYTPEYPLLLTEFRRAFRAAPENLVLGNDFQVELSGDGVHMTSGSCSKLLDEALLRLPGVSLPPVTNKMAELRAESAATRELLLDLAERFRTHAASSNSMTASAAEQLDAASNRSNECQIEIRGSYWIFSILNIILTLLSEFFKIVHFDFKTFKGFSIAILYFVILIVRVGSCWILNQLKI